jgi:hypothetical protein|tara:strand:- start:112 stop:1047 length:936 start_codon:yes stop_codon:yes gene_type:complete
MSFTTRISNYTNTVSAENLTDALKKGVDYTLATVKLRNPAIWSQFAIKVNSGSSVFGDIYPTFNIFDLLSVDRKQGAVSYWARPIEEKQFQKATDPTSIYYATYHDPVYSISSDGIMDIQPTETATNPASIYIVRDSGGKTITDATEVILDDNISFGGVSLAPGEQFPSFCKELVVLHAAECILMERLIDFRTSIPTGLDAEWANALAKAKLLFDDGANIEGDNAGASMSVQYWLSDEDEDMTSSTISAIQSEVGRANAYVQKFKTDLERIATDYQWTQGQLQMINGKKQEFIQNQLQGGLSDDGQEGRAV